MSDPFDPLSRALCAKNSSTPSHRRRTPATKAAIGRVSSAVFDGGVPGGLQRGRSCRECACCLWRVARSALLTHPKPHVDSCRFVIAAHRLVDLQPGQHVDNASDISSHDVAGFRFD